MSARLTNEYGYVEIDKQVIAQIVYRAAMESYGLVGLGYKSKGIVELLKGENATKRHAFSNDTWHTRRTRKTCNGFK